MSESDVDIYDDLPDFRYDGKLEELQSTVDSLLDKNDTLYARFVEVSEKKKELVEKCNTLASNISMLLKTAQAEINRKDKTIKDLREELAECRKRKNGQYPRNQSSLNFSKNQTSPNRKFIKARRQTNFSPQDKIVNPYENRSNCRLSYSPKDDSKVVGSESFGDSKGGKREEKKSAEQKADSKENQVPQDSPKVAPNKCPPQNKFKTLFSERMNLRNRNLAMKEAEKVIESKMETRQDAENKRKVENQKVKLSPGSPKRKNCHVCPPEEIKPPKKNCVVENTEVGKERVMRVTRRTRCAINPISRNWNLAQPSPPRRVTRSSVAMKPPPKKAKLDPPEVAKTPPKSAQNGILLDIFGSPVQWADSSSDGSGNTPKIDLSSPAVYEDSCSAQIENAQFLDKSLEVRVKEPERPFQSLNKKSLFSPEKSSSLTSNSVSLPPLVFEKKPQNTYEDTFMGQFESTTQFISALTKVQAQISPLNTPSKSLQPIDDKSPKPVNVLQPRKTPRIVTNAPNKVSVNKSCSIKDSFISEQEKRVKNLKINEKEKVLVVFGSPRNSKKPLQTMDWVLKPLELQPETTKRRQSLNMDNGPNMEANKQAINNVEKTEQHIFNHQKTKEQHNKQDNHECNKQTNVNNRIVNKQASDECNKQTNINNHQKTKEQVNKQDNPECNKQTNINNQLEKTQEHIVNKRASDIHESKKQTNETSKEHIVNKQASSIQESSKQANINNQLEKTKEFNKHASDECIKQTNINNQFEKTKNHIVSKQASGIQECSKQGNINNQLEKTKTFNKHASDECSKANENNQIQKTKEHLVSKQASNIYKQTNISNQVEKNQKFDKHASEESKGTNANNQVEKTKEYIVNKQIWNNYERNKEANINNRRTKDIVHKQTSENGPKSRTILLNSLPSVEDPEKKRNKNETKMAKLNGEMDSHKMAPNPPVKLIRHNRQVKLSNVDNPGKLTVARHRPINFSASS